MLMHDDCGGAIVCPVESGSSESGLVVVRHECLKCGWSQRVQMERQPDGRWLEKPLE